MTDTAARLRVLLVHPILDDRGGSNQVAAWAIQALAEECDLSVVTLRPIDLAAVDRFAETRLATTPFRTVVAGRRVDALIERLPLRLSLLGVALAVRAARGLERAEHFDCWLSTFNEVDLGRPGLQYVHYPWTHMPRPLSEVTWYSRSPRLLRAYQRLCCAAGGMSRDRLGENLTLANSAFVAARVAESIGGRIEVLPPPVAGEFAPRPWAERRDEVVCVGRISPEKNIFTVVAAVEAARSRGFDLTLRIVGLANDRETLHRLEEAASRRPWLVLELEAARPRLLEILHRARWGMHAMHGEHFGIGVAEMIRAGCIVFAHASGGPVEILGGDRRLLFTGSDEAADKLCAALSSDELRLDLSRRLTERAANYGTNTFCRRIVEAVRSVAARDRNARQPRTTEARRSTQKGVLSCGKDFEPRRHGDPPRRES